MPQLRLLFLFILCVAATSALAQVQAVRGTVRDARTKEKLPFVSIAVNGGETGTTTNLNGQYELRHNRPITSLRFSYVGYAPQQLSPDSTGILDILLQPTAAQLQEVVIRSGINPAHRIIRLATQNREHHRTENLDAYTYRTYNKFILTATDLRDTLSQSYQDSAYLRMRSLLAKQHLFLMESITDYAYLKPDHTQETILATRVSGLQQPSFGVVAAEARDFSVYADMPVFFGKRYLSPLSPGSTRKYDFILQETSIVGPDTVFIISFKPQKGKNFEGLKGLLYINSKGWAVQNLIAESATDDKRGIKLQQQFEQVSGQWFPKELDVELTVHQISLKGHQPYGHIRTYITNVNLHPNLQRKDFGAIALRQTPTANRQPELIWQQNRPDSLSLMEQRTYQRLDSVGRADHLDRTIHTVEYILAKQIPLGPISLDIDRLLRVSRFEGLRLGLGAHTNNRFSERFAFGGYWGYGFRDKEEKYGADASLILHQPSELKVAIDYFEDVLEPGSRRLPFRQQRSLVSELRPAVLDQLDYTTHYGASVSGRLLRYLQVQTLLRREQRRPTLVFDSLEVSPADINVTEAAVGFRYAYGEQFMQLFGQTLPMVSTYPVLWFQYTRGIDGLLNGAYSYNKYDARLEASFRHRSTGETSLTFAGGLVRGRAPFTNLYNGYGSYSRKYTIYAGEGFETMRPYEFFSDRYAALFLKQNFGKRLLRTSFFKPDLVLVTNIGFGDLDQQPAEQPELTFNTMHKGFYESGMMLNNIISSPFTGVGVGAFYRYGPYAFDKPADNLKFKMTLTLSF